MILDALYRLVHSYPMYAGSKKIWTIFLLLFSYLLLPQENSAQKKRNQKPPVNITISPLKKEKIIPSFEKFIEHQIQLKSDRPVQVYVRMVFDTKPQEIQIFTNHIKWAKKKDAYYYTDLSGKPALLTLGKEPLTLPLAIKIKLAEKSRAKIEVVKNKQASSSGEIILVPLKNADDLYQIGKKYPRVSLIISILVAALAGGLFFYLWSKQRDSREHKKIARGLFSARIPDNGQIFISEKENPFHCRLWGFKKKVRIHYSRSQIILQYTFHNKRLTDVYPLEIKINRHWILKLNAEHFEENGKTGRALSVLLIPQN